MRFTVVLSTVVQFSTNGHLEAEGATAAAAAATEQLFLNGQQALLFPPKTSNGPSASQLHLGVALPHQPSQSLTVKLSGLTNHFK